MVVINMIFIILFSLAHVFCAVGVGPHPMSSIYNCVESLRATATSAHQYPVNSTLVSFPYDLLRKNLSSGNLIKFPRINIDTIRYPSWQQFGAYSNTIAHTRHYFVYATSNSMLHHKSTRNKSQNDCESEKYVCETNSRKHKLQT
jgi:hypothetical protein